MSKPQLKSLFVATFLCTALSTAAFAQAEKPPVTILATGGTIAGSSASNTDTTGYKAGALGIDVLINAVPQMNDVAVIKGEQIANIASDDVNSEILLKLSKRVNQLLNEEGQQGVVITHGTDTIEESAFFLDLTVKSNKPTVVVGAMRPATAISADGPMNLLEAVALAADKRAEDRGVLVVANDRINSAYYTSKTNSTTVDTFKAIEQGYLGVFVSSKPKFYYEAAQPVGKAHFDVSQMTSLPRVDVVYFYQEQDEKALKSAVDNGAKGIIIASAGNGGMSSSFMKAAHDLAATGFPIVVSTRTGSGYVSHDGNLMNAGFLNPQKARILLQLAIASEAQLPQIATYFDTQR